MWGCCWRIAQQLKIDPQRLGVSDEPMRPAAAASASVLVSAEDPVAHSQSRWHDTRRWLNRNRALLALIAARLYRGEVRSTASALALPQWLLSHPVRLEDVRSEWVDGPVGALVTGGEPEAAPVLPLRAPGQRYTRYTFAIRYLARPALFENRPSYRLVDLDVDGPSVRLRFCLGTYFDKLDVSEAVAHEMALAYRSHSDTTPPWSALRCVPWSATRSTCARVRSAQRLRR